MVYIQQLFVPAVFLFGLAEQVAAAPLGSNAGIAVRDVNERDFENFGIALRALYGDELDLETRANLFNTLKAVPSALKAIKHVMPGSKKLTTAVSGAIKTKNALTGAAKAVGKAVKNNKGKTFDRVLATANTGMNAAQTAKKQQGKRDLEDLELVLRSLSEDEMDLETRANILGALKKLPTLAKGAAKFVGNTIKSNKGKTFDRVLKTADTSMNIAKTVKTQQGKRDLEDLELILRSFSDDEMDLETRANILGALKKLPTLAKGAAKLVGNTIKSNKGKTFDRVLKTADFSMNIAKTAKTKRDVEGLGSQLRSRNIKKAKKGTRASKKSKKTAASRKRPHSKKPKADESEN